MLIFLLLISITKSEWNTLTISEKLSLLDTLQNKQELMTILKFIPNEPKEIRIKFAEVCGKLKLVEGVDFLINSLNDKEAAVRFEAAWSLGEIRSKKALKPLQEAIKDYDPAVRYNVVVALGNIGSEEAMPGLSLALKDRIPRIRKEACLSIAKIKPTKLPKEILPLLHDQKREVIFAAIKAIGESQDEKMVENLAIFLKSKDDSLRAQASFYLARFKNRKALETLIEDINFLPVAYREKAAQVMSSFPDEELSLEGIKKMLKDQSWQVRKSASAELKKFGKKAEEIILQQLKQEKNPDVLEELIFTAGVRKEKSASPYISLFLDSQNPLLREEACRAAGWIKDTTLIAPLKKRIRDDSPLVQQEALLALGRMRVEEAFDDIIWALNVSVWEVQEAACKALGLLGKKEAISALERMLYHKWWGVRKASLWAIGRLNGEEKLLRRMMKDENREIRGLAHLFLAKIQSLKEEEISEDIDPLYSTACRFLLGLSVEKEFKELIIKNPKKGAYVLDLMHNEWAKELLKEMSQTKDEELQLYVKSLLDTW